jgi:hypothetical protein
MTQQEILDYNKRCVEFLPFNYRNQSKYWVIYKYDDNSFFGKNRKYLAVNNLKFHSDWNWIMEVVEAIQKIIIKDNDEFCIEFYEGLPNKPKTFVSIGKLEAESEDPKEAVVQAINQFLIWYEQNKKK